MYYILFILTIKKQPYKNIENTEKEMIVTLYLGPGGGGGGGGSLTIRLATHPRSKNASKGVCF